jgi:hypothetical protein
MSEEESNLLRSLKRFHGKRLLLDANLLHSYLMGCFYRENQPAPNRGAFKEDEFVLLAQIINHCKKAGRILTTPNLLTEISNLSKRLKPNRGAYLCFIRSMTRDLDEQVNAKRIGASRLAAQDFFLTFGLADAAIMDLAYDPLLILTNDKPLARCLRNKKRRKNDFYFGDLKVLWACFEKTDSKNESFS